jgi:hypothetical protein
MIINRNFNVFNLNFFVEWKERNVQNAQINQYLLIYVIDNHYIKNLLLKIS